MSMKIDEAILIILVFEAIKGDYELVLVEVKYLKILANALPVGDEDNIGTKIKRVVGLPLRANKIFLDGLAHLTIQYLK